MLIHRNKRDRGFVLITMTLTTIAIIAAVGLAVDMGHLYLIKNETQTFADAAALAAALQLNGSNSGITNANSAVTTLKTSDKWNFGTTSVGTPTVEFTTSTAGAAANAACTGTWTTAPPNPPTGYNCVRVTVSVAAPIYFAPIVMPTPAFTSTVASRAVAAQIDVQTVGTGLAPYSGVAESLIGPDFGLTVGGEYNIQWPQFSGSAQCKSQTPDKCFNQKPCNDETKASEWAVASNWPSSNSGYWGASSNSVIESYILGGAQLEAVSVGTNIAPVLTSGQKNSEGGWLDWKVNNDTDSTDTTWAAYSAKLNAGTANGQRMIDVPILNPVDPTHTNVLGYGQYMLETNAKNNLPGDSNLYTHYNGNEGWCAIYAGYITLGSTTPGVGGSSGAAQVQLIQ